MPFQSYAQETYLKRRQPEVYRDWVKRYGHYRGKKLHATAKARKDLRNGYRTT